MARPKAKDHDDKRNMILSTAAAVFAKTGIAGTSMNDVAKACGISKPNIYHYCGSKNELVFVILDTYLSALKDRISSLDLSGKTAQEQLGALTTEFLLAYDGMDNEHKIQTEGVPLLPIEQQTILKGYQRDMVQIMANTIAACAPDDMANNPAKCRDVTMSVFGMLNWFYLWSPGADETKRLAYAQTVTDLVLNGMSGPSDP